MGLKAIARSSGGGAATSITINSTAITGGTDTRVLFDDAGVVGESAGLTYVKGTGTLSATAVVGGNVTSSALTQYRVTVSGAAGLLSDSAGLTFGGAAAGTGLAIAAGTATTDVAALSVTRTNNNAAVATGVKFAFTDTTSASSFLPLQVTGGASATTNLFSVDKAGKVALGPAPSGSTGVPTLTWNGDTGTGFYLGTTNQLLFASASTDWLNFGSTLSARSDWGLQWSTNSTVYGGSRDLTLSRGGASQIVYGGNGTLGGGAAASRAEVNKSVTAIADATPTATFTVTIPNGAHSGMLEVNLVGSLGAGGAIGANEASATISYNIAITRVSGVNATATISSAYGSAATAVAGAATVTVTAALSAISGAVGATNTFTVNVTITKSGGSSANHTCLCYGRLMNANATGITIA